MQIWKRVYRIVDQEVGMWIRRRVLRSGKGNYIRRRVYMVIWRRVCRSARGCVDQEEDSKSGEGTRITDHEEGL